MVTPLLTTKTYLPPVRPDLVERPRLVERLNDVLHHKLTLVSAPAGFGKTTLLSEWIQHTERPVAWLSLDRRDNDPIRFWSYVVAALRTVDDSIGGTAQAALQSPELPPLEPLVTTLINDLAITSSPLVLVLDDYHLIDSEMVHDSLNFLLDHLPPQLHLVIATRADPPLLLARRRGRAELVEIRAEDLRFTTEETTEFINTVRKLGLSAQDVATLGDRTEGWIVGLQMAALSLQDRVDKHEFVAIFAGDDRYVVDYLVEEMLRRQPAHVQSFLLRTSILERLCGPLCDAVVGGSDSQVILDALEQANLFVVSLDNRRCWYRYHHLFADLLRGHLRQSVEEQGIAQLHLQASRWYEKEGDIAEAMSHALMLPDAQQAAALIERHAPAMLDHGKIVLTLHWLRALPDHVICNSPLLCISRAWAELYDPSRSIKSSSDSAEQWVQAAEKAWAARTSDQDTHRNSDRAVQNRLISNVAALRALISWHRRDAAPWRHNNALQETLQSAHQALDCIPKNDLRLRCVVLHVLSQAQWLLGNRQTASQTLIKAQRAGEASGNLRIALQAAYTRTMIMCGRGKFRRGAEICQQALRTIAEPREQMGRPLPAAGALYIALGGILLEWGDLERAEQALSKGMALNELVGNMRPLIWQWDYEVSIRLKVHQGDLAGAMDLIERMERTRPEDSYAAIFRARLWLLQVEHNPEYLDAATQWAEERQIKLDYTGQHSVEQLTLARLLIAQYRAHQHPAAPVHSLPNLQGLLQALDNQLQIAEKTGRDWWVIEVLILRAMALQALGDNDQALTALRRALALAEPEGFLLMFVDEGRPMAQLLYQVAERGATDYVGRLLAAFPDAPLIKGDDDWPTVTKGHGEVIEPLTRREIEVLHLIAEGLSNREIAQRLVISPGTVKTHTRNIYGKLQVKSRTQAVAKAKGLGILPPD